MRTVAHGSSPIYIHLQISPLGHGNQSQIDDLIPQLLKVSSFVMEGSDSQRGNGHKTDSWHEAATWRLGNFRLATLIFFKLQNTHPNHQLYPHTLRFIELCFKNTVGRPQHKGFLRAMEAPHQRAKSHETDYSNCVMIQPP